MSAGFWNDSYWLPRADKWSDVPIKVEELWTAVYLAFPIFVFRILFESFIGLGFGKLFGYVEGPLPQAIVNHILGGFVRNTKSKKVLETFWRFSAYSFLFCFGIYTLHDKPWLYNVHHGFIGYPRHPIENIVKWYYMIQCGFYMSLLLASPFDVKRKDYWEMFVHHVVTIGLICFSWTVNFVRIGTLVLFSHDINDIFLEFCKLIRYTKKNANLSNAFFVVFLISWIASRLIYFPFFVVITGVRDGPGLIQPDYVVWDITQVPYSPRILLGLLSALMILHVFWTYLIFKIVVKALREGEASDVRSDSEESDEDSQKSRSKLKTKRKPEKID